MARPLRGVPGVVDTSADRVAPMSPQTFSQTTSPVGSLLAAPQVSPEPAYIAPREAGQIITREVLVEFHQVDDADLTDVHDSSLSQITDSALSNVNHFLDRILHNILSSSRSLSLANLRTAVKDVLKPRLAGEAIGGADEELIECIGEDDEVDLFEDATEVMDGAFDLDLVWKRARLRCMVYTRLGDMEEDDEERYIEDHSLDGYVDGRRMSRNNGLVSPPVAIWLTAILEYIGENALMIASHHAYRRCETKYGRGLAGQQLHHSVVTVTDGDLEKIALNPSLGRLWRAWRKPLKSPRASIGRALSVESMRHRRGDSRSSIGFARKASSETLSSLQEPQTDHELALPRGHVRKDFLAERPEVEAAQDANAVPADVDPADIPLPLSQYDIAEIEVPGFNPTPDLEGREADEFLRTKRPISMVFPGSSDPTALPETFSPRGPRHMRSQSLPGARRPSVYQLLEESTAAAETLDDDTAKSSVGDRPVSDVSQGEVFSSLTSPADYQTPGDERPRETNKPSRRNKEPAVPPADRKSGLSEYGGPEGPVLFDRSDYRVDPNEIPVPVPTMHTTVMSPHVTAATPTETPGTPASPPTRSGLRSNRPVSLAIGSQNNLAAPGRVAGGEISPMVEGDYLDSGEVSPLEPSDDEGSVSIAGLKDAKEHMGLDPLKRPVRSSARSSAESYEDASETAVSPLSPPEAPSNVPARTWIEPPAPQPRREIVPVAVAPSPASRPRQGEAMTRQTSDERRHEAREAAIVSPRPATIEKDNLPDIPRQEQISKLEAAAKAHNNVAVPQPERIYRSMSKDMTPEAGLPVATASGLGAPPTTTTNLTTPTSVQTNFSSPEHSPAAILATANPTTITKIHRKEVSLDSRPPVVQTHIAPQDSWNQYAEGKTQSQNTRGQYQERKPLPQDPRSQYPDPRPQSQAAQNQYQDPRTHVQNQASNYAGPTPLHLQQSSTGETGIAPPTSKLLERRRQLPQVDTVSPDRAGVQRLTTSPQSPSESVQTLPPPRSVPDQTLPAVAPPVPRDSTPPAPRRPASRKTSRSGEDVFGHKATKSRGSSHERSKEFEQLIDSGETIQYTLTPQNIRSYQAAEAAPEAVPMQPSNSRDRGRGLSFGNKSRSNVGITQPQPAPQPTLSSNGPVVKPFVGYPVRRPAGTTPTTFVSMQGKKSGLAPREAKTDMGSMRDFADFMRTTGPTENADTFSGSQKVVRAPVPVRNADIQAKPQIAGLPNGMRSPSSPSFGTRSASGTTTGSKRRGPRLQARDPQTNDKSTSDLIDFIREGPPGEAGSQRTPRTGPAFATTVDSDEMRNGLSSHPTRITANHNRYAPSINSTQESFKTASGISSSNSHTGLLANARGNAANLMGGLEEEPQGMMPVRKSRKPRDPYAIDVSDEEEEYGGDGRNSTPRGGHGREESLVEFLQSQLPPANASSVGVSSLGRPIGSGPGMARPKPQARAAAGAGRSDTNELADFFRNSAPPAGMNLGHQTSVQTMPKEKKGLGGMFKRARG